MGLVRTSIYFDDGLPPMAAIAESYKKITGYPLGIVARLHLLYPASLTDITNILCEDHKPVSQVQSNKIALFQDSRYTESAVERDKLKAYNHIQSLSFDCWFYVIDFTVTEHQMEIRQESNQFYAVESLIRALINAGGSFKDDDILKKKQKIWLRLKPWNEYKWYNRPVV
ncbi:hypothetical protein [Arsenicibacter rosenii]|uniref:Uncharacterized protein n=1 Tax=Arsenicibacter rosenii TaxID=1750698 RepID=A0A1S2VBM6_9BACT|nr:hypothetical protein [Arsenicibacter rosenii]OIN55715.1 hypothetical protein BLX24_28555 [Arsenicibacter rosenii]